MRNLLIRNIGKIVSGDINTGVIEGANTILVKDGIIAKIGREQEIDTANIDIDNVIDVNGQTVIPGLIDAHVHNALDDYAPQMGTIGCFEDALLGGTTTMISEGEQGPGFPRFYNDPVGCKATAILARKVFEKFRPGGALKLHAGALVLVDGLSQKDFLEMHQAGVWLISEIGGGGISNISKIVEMVGWARQYDFFVSAHLSPPSIPGSSWIGAKEILTIQPDKVAHANGGSTAVPFEEIEQIIDESELSLELVVNGNPKVLNRIVQILDKKNELHRLVLGSDSPTGQASLPGAIVRAVVRVSALNDIPAEKAIAMATGNTADLYGLNTGKIEVGREADLVVIDRPPGSSGENALDAIEKGDMFGCSLVIVDGEIVGIRGKDTRATARWCTVDGVEMRVRGINEFIFFPPRFIRHDS